MPSFLFVYRSQPWDPSQVPPEEMQKSMDRWMKWIGDGFAQGWLLDAGDALLPDGRLVHNDKTVTDGPFMESKEVVGGYAIVKADTIEAAAALAKDNPNIAEGGSVEVRPLAGLGPPK